MWLTMKFAESFLWFGTYEYLEKTFPKSDNKYINNLNYGLKGITSSFMSDILTNPLRSLKIYKQSSEKNITYKECVKNIIKDDGISKLFLRGLNTRLITHGIQSGVFVILWKNIEEILTI